MTENAPAKHYEYQKLPKTFLALCAGATVLLSGCEWNYDHNGDYVSNDTVQQRRDIEATSQARRKEMRQSLEAAQEKRNADYPTIQRLTTGTNRAEWGHSVVGSSLGLLKKTSTRRFNYDADQKSWTWNNGINDVSDGVVVQAGYRDYFDKQLNVYKRAAIGHQIISCSASFHGDEGFTPPPKRRARSAASWYTSLRNSSSEDMLVRSVSCTTLTPGQKLSERRSQTITIKVEYDEAAQELGDPPIIEGYYVEGVSSVDDNVDEAINRLNQTWNKLAKVS